MFVCRQIQGHVEQMGLRITSCGDDVLQFCRCLAASFFLNAALKQPDGTYRHGSESQMICLKALSPFAFLHA
ncbi:hypothetical protein ACFXTI_011115 [Malus domestica]